MALRIIGKGQVAAPHARPGNHWDSHRDLQSLVKQLAMCQGQAHRIGFGTLDNWLRNGQGVVPVSALIFLQDGH